MHPIGLCGMSCVLGARKILSRIPKKKRKKRRGDVSSESNEEDGSQHKTAGSKILDVEPSITVDFTIPKSFENRKKAQRYPMNPEENWGPKKAATGYKRKVTTQEAPQD
mmetsp:Transcript_10882/g.15131  ORF Transcript_10882/g.15131 Transcript_10882/m.15131 type:complete len:109 (-) Transcript_10882:37-363(-)